MLHFLLNYYIPVLLPFLKFQTVVINTSISSQVLQNADDGRTLPSIPNLRKIGCAQ